MRKNMRKRHIIKNKSNPEIRKVMKLGCITSRQIANKLNYTSEWISYLLRNDLDNDYKEWILWALTELIEERREELAEAEKILNEMEGSMKDDNYKESREG